MDEETEYNNKEDSLAGIIGRGAEVVKDRKLDERAEHRKPHIFPVMHKDISCRSRRMLYTKYMIV